MKHKKYKNKSKHERKKSKRKDKQRDKEEKHNESDSSSSTSEGEQEWVEKPISQTIVTKKSVHMKSKEEESLKREDWMNIKSVFPCVFNEKKTESFNSNKNASKSDLDKLGQSDRELNPYWKNGGSGLPEENSTKIEQVMDVNWLKRSLQRAKEQAKSENRSLEEIAAVRWGVEVIQSMISKAEGTSIKDKWKHNSNTTKESKFENQYKSTKNSNRNDQYKRHDNLHYEHQRKQEYKKPTDDNCFNNTSYKSNHTNKKNWQKSKMSDKTEENQLNSNMVVLKSISNDNTNDTEVKEIKSLTEAEMNKLGAKIVKAELMGNTEVAEKLKIQLKEAREAAKSVQVHNTEKVQNIILTQTDAKGVTRLLELRNQPTEFSQNIKRKNAETHTSGKKVRYFFDDDKYSLQQLFQKEKGRTTNEDDAAFIKVASKNMDMDEMFEEHITRVKLDAKQDEKDRSFAIKEHKRLSKCLDTCRWCIDSKYMLKHMIIEMNSEICLCLPQYSSLTVGHCIITPVQHVACQLQLDENVWENLKMFKRTLYKMFMDQNQYPVFYETYKSRYKFTHMKLDCIPLPKEVGELAPMYFKKALLECETEWSMNKKVIDLEHKDVRHAIPNGLSYFMVEFETNKGYAHVIEDEHLFPKNFAEEIIGGMLDLDHDVWRKPKRENLDQQREKTLKFLEVWKKYEFKVKKS
ncbi:CWF19-like protein 2 [Habropoda laboriosa]|uniref:CWF19-like protein 2 n=1 Tax=Habropoda laboriosa TaxID=597456 RepID=A0A0L7QL69_9HYME|nr:CWF19-like protein 2 [Habropoda laboriosa]